MSWRLFSFPQPEQCRKCVLQACPYKDRNINMTHEAEKTVQKGLYMMDPRREEKLEKCIQKVVGHFRTEATRNVS